MENQIKNSNKNKFRILHRGGTETGMILVVVVIGLAILFAFGRFSRQINNGNSGIYATPTIIPTSLVSGVITAASIDPLSGIATLPVNKFKSDASSIYLVLDLNNSPINTKISYVRYLNSKYLDSKDTFVIKPNIRTLSFAWKLKTSSSLHPVGQYLVKVYSNGTFEKATTYTVY